MNDRSVGKIIEDRRKELGLTREECSKRTRISKKFLEAIESDNYDAFPGEVYYIGFLRTYAQILSLDANKLIHNYYKQKKIEEPAPLEELTKPLKREIKLPQFNKNSLPLILVMAVVFIIIIGVIILVTIPEKQKVEVVKKDVTVNKNEKEFILLQRRIIKNFLPGEVLVLPDGNYNHKINILSIDKELKFAQISILELDKKFELKENDILKFDFNDNNEFDLQLTVNKISSEGLSLTIERLTTQAGNKAFTDKNIQLFTFEENSDEKVELKSQIYNQIFIVVQANRNGYVRLESDTDGNIEKFLLVGESLKISASKQAIIQITNANYMTVFINNNPVELPKEFAIYCIVKWVYDQQTDKYNLITEFKK